MAGAWTEDDQKKLLAMIEAGMAPRRIAVRMRRPLHSIKARAKEAGKPFPLERDLKRARMKILNPPK